MESIESLPVEIIAHLFSFVDADTAANLEEVCPEFRYIITRYWWPKWLLRLAKSNSPFGNYLLTKHSIDFSEDADELHRKITELRDKDGIRNLLVTYWFCRGLSSIAM